MVNNQYVELCLVTDSDHVSSVARKQFLLEVAKNGVTSVQLRLKNKPREVCHAMALEVKAILDPLHIPLIINDDVGLAKAIDAFGVHLGQSDMAPVDARKILGAGKIIGWSIETMFELEQANELDCIDYIAASAVFPSQTKTDCKTIWGLDGLKKIVARSRHPVVAIGGIDVDNAADVIETGVSGIAVVSAIHAAQNPGIIARELSAILRGEKNEV